ncbi:nucleotidyltransferase domain-containing protein [Methanocaldococcus sp. 28A]
MHDKALSYFLKNLKKKFGNKIKKVILFGSYARGDYNEESDIDILIIGDVELDDIIDLVVDIMVKYGILINVIIKNENEFNKLKYSSFYSTILNEGIEIL